MPNLEDLKTDLFYLRRDAGLTEERLYTRTEDFFNILGGKAQGFETLKQRIISAIDSLPDKQSAETVKVAFGLLPEYENLPRLTDRREAYGKRINRKPDTIADRENAAIDELAIQLLTGCYTSSPIPSGIPTMHKAAIQERVEIVTLVRDRLWTETREYYRLIPLMDDVDYLEVSSSIPAQVVSTCDAIAKSDSIDGGLKHCFWYKEPLKRGKPTELSFVMLPDGTRNDELILLDDSRAFHEQSFSFGIEVIFIGQKPRLIWQYKQLPFFERPGKPTKEQLLNLNNGSSVKAEFTDLYGGLFSGIAWEW